MASRLASWFGAAALAAAIVPSARGDEPVDVHIPAQKLDAALLELAEQTNISIAFPAEGIGNVTSSSVHGQLDPGDALIRALAGTGFAAERVGDNAWKIVSTPPTDRPIPDWHAPSQIKFVAKPDTADSQLASELQKVVVVSKRAEQLSQIARSVSVIGSDSLNTIGARTLPDLTGKLGTIQFSNVGSGRNKAYIRGVSDGALAGRAQSATGLYLGDVRLTYAAPDPDLRLSDINSISILSGPQGALYGAGSIGGIVRIQPNAPDLKAAQLDTSASIEQAGDRSVGSAIDLVANLPVVRDTFGIRLVAYAETTGGWIDHQNLDIEDANTSSRMGGRLSASWTPGTDTRINLLAVSQNIEVDDSQYLIQYDGGASRPSILEPHENDFRLLSGSIETHTGLGILNSTTSLLSHNIYSRYDATGLFPDLLADFISPRPIDEDDKLFYVTNESRLSSPAEARIPWFAGMFVSQGHTDRDVYLRDGDFGAWQDVVYEEDRRDRITEYAVFGEMIWNLDERWTLTTGARVFGYDIKVKATTDTTAGAAQRNFSGKLSKTGLAPDIRLKWQATPQIMTYLSAAEGYRGPGFNTGGFSDLSGPDQTQPNRVFSGDELWTYEFGARYIAPDGHLVLAATLFENDWSNVQTDELFVDDFAFTGNAGDSSGYGAEFHVTYEPDGHWLLQSNLMINEPEIVRPDPNFPVDTNSSLPGATEWSGSFSATYRSRAVLFGHSANVSLAMSGEFIGPSTALFRTGTQIGSRSELDLHAGIETGSLSFSAYADNLLDSSDPTFSNGNPYQVLHWNMRTPLRPRTLGFRISKSFK
ncbi:MAG: TonB-dependent receptor [Hyphomonas sp.]|nr:TonB-dependent receptor [Hyphomonas sp.]